jgi:hypothetical protein
MELLDAQVVVDDARQLQGESDREHDHRSFLPEAEPDPAGREHRSDGACGQHRRDDVEPQIHPGGAADLPEAAAVPERVPDLAEEHVAERGVEHRALHDRLRQLLGQMLLSGPVGPRLPVEAQVAHE